MSNKEILFSVKVKLEIILSPWIWSLVCFPGDLRRLTCKAAASTVQPGQ